MLLYIIRHGEPIYGPDTLTELGREQAKAVGKRLSVHGFDRIYSSPNGRARETAQPTCEALGMTPEILPWASEDLLWRDLAVPDVGWSFNGDVRQLRASEMTLPDSPWYDAPVFDGALAPREGYERIAAGADELLRGLGYEHEGQIYRIVNGTNERVALFCHQGVGVTLVSHLLNIPPCLFWTSFDMTHTGVTVIHFEDHGYGYTSAKCLVLSDTAHIYEAGLPYRYSGHNHEDVPL